MGWITTAVNAFTGGMIPGAGEHAEMLFGDDGGGGEDPNPLLTEALRTLSNYKAIAPHQLAAMREFNPQFAEQYGRDQASIASGSLPTYENIISPTLSRVNSQQRGADIADVELYGPRAREAILASNPDSARLLKLLNEQAETGLKAGSKLRPEDMYQVSKRIKGNYANRGFEGPMPAADLEEAMQLYASGQDVQDRRRSFAGNVLGYNQSVVGDPFMQILGRSGQSVSQVGNLYGQGQAQYDQAGTGTYDPFKDAYSTMFHNQDIKLAEDNADKQLTGAVIGGLLGAAGSGAAAFCWAAREVFQDESLTSKGQGLKWEAFREWLLTEAPAKLRNWYMVNGERWAARLHENPLAKQVVRRWMERRIAGSI